MKRILFLTTMVVALLFGGCAQEFDDSEIWEEIDSIKSRVLALETVTNAYKNNLFIKSVEQIENGYVITFSDGSKATILNGKDGADGKDGENGADGKDGQDGADGKDGQDGADGKDGENGADGKDGQDGADGKDGQDGADGETLIESIVIGENEVTFILTDGSSFSIPLYSTLTISFDTDDLVVMSPNSTREIHYTVKSILTDVVVEVTSSADIKAKVVADDESGLTGKIEIKTGATIDEYSKVIVFVSNGEKVIMRSITFEEAGLVVEEDAATKQATAEGGEVVLEFLSNVECEAVIPDDAKSWISVVPATRALTKQTITLKLEPNDGATRSAEVIVKSVDGNLSLTYTISQEPNLDYQLALEREALIAFYNATGGDNWFRNDNWCSDKPIEEWYGIQTGVWPSEASFGKLYSISLDENNLTGAITNELDSLSYLNFISIRGNNLTFVNIDACPELNSIDCSDNNITNINIRNCPQFNSLGCDNNKLSKLDVSHLPDLQILSCRNNNISLLNISNCAKLVSLSCGGNPITKLDLKNNPELDYLYVYGIPISSIDLSNCQKLRVLYLGGNPLSSLDVSNCYALEYLDCDDCNLTNLDISHNPRLTQLSCENNNLISLKINNPKLQNLLCRNTTVPFNLAE